MKSDRFNFGVMIKIFVFFVIAVSAKPNLKNADSILLTQTEATSFAAKRTGNYPTREGVHMGLKTECCDKNCVKEEIDEFGLQSPFSIAEVHKVVCELSLSDANECRCDGEICGRSYYKAGQCPDVFPCGNQWHCYLTPPAQAWISTTCIPEEKFCDFHPDCPNLEDEGTQQDECRITNRTKKATVEANTVLKDKTGTKKSGYWGNVFITDKAVCESGWQNEDYAATLLCHALSKNPERYYPYSDHVQGQLVDFIQRLDFDFKYIMSDIRCRGDETFIGDCVHKTYNTYCESHDYNTAYIVCLDSASTKLDGSRDNFEGRVTLIDAPLVVRHLTEERRDLTKISKQVCNSVHGQGKFRDRAAGVPMHSFDEKLLLNYHDIYCTLVNSCTGNERSISECNLRFKVGNCISYNQLIVSCAKCDDEKLVSIVNSVTYAGDLDSVESSIRSAQQKLKKECQAWDDCEEVMPQYIEYCRVKAFLDEALLTLKSSEKSQVVTINTNTDPLKKLELHFLEQSFDDLNKKVDEMGRQIVKQLGDYFKNVADFDQDQAHIDVAASLGLYTAARDTSVKIEQELGPQIDDILKAALVSASGNVIEKGIHVGLASVSCMNPISYLTEGAGPVSDLLNAMADLAAAALKVAEVAQVGKLLEDASSAIKGIRDGITENENIYKMSKAILGSERQDLDEAMSASNVKKFLVHYNNFNPSVNNDKVVTYVGYIQEIIDTSCGVIKDPQSTLGAVAGAYAIATNVCPKAQVNLARLEANMESMQERQEEIMDGLARAARSSIAGASATELKHSLEGSLSDKVKRAIVSKNSLVMFRVHKSMLVDYACNYITYMHHGEESSKCTRLRKNPEGPVNDVISFTKTNMCAVPNAEKIVKTVRIPIDLEVSSGALNFDTLIQTRESGGTEGYATFKIPNKQWLLDNNWVEDDHKNTNNFYIEKMNVFLPPSSRITHTVNVKVTFRNNKIGQKKYTINGGQRVSTRYTENSNSAECPHETKESPYTVASCDTNYGRICVNSQGVVPGDLLPSMVGTAWMFKVNSPFELLRMYPAQPSYIYAQISYCAIVPAKKKAAAKKTSKRKLNATKRTSGSHGTCCSKLSPEKFYRPTGDECKACPDDSQPRLFDHYCEKCPSGTEPSEYLYGCQPCERNKFKAEAGPARCQDCPDGKVARGTGFRECYPSP